MVREGVKIKMQHSQWIVLVCMSIIFFGVSMIFAMLSQDPYLSMLFYYFGILWFIATIACFVLGSLEKV